MSSGMLMTTIHPLPMKALEASALAMYTVPQKNDTDVAHYNLDADQPILIIFGRYVAKTVCYPMAISYHTSPN